jgi:hypothetical protein
MSSAYAPSGSLALDRMSVGEVVTWGLRRAGFGKHAGTPVLAFGDSVLKCSLVEQTLQVSLAGSAKTRARKHAGCPRLFTRNNMHRTPRAIGGLISVALISKRHYLGSKTRGRTASGSDMFLCLSIYCGLNLAKEYANGSNILLGY